MKQKQANVYCPACKNAIPLDERLSLAYRSCIYCKQCRTTLTPSISSRVLATCALGVPAWFIDRLPGEVSFNETLKFFLGFATMMLLPKLASPACSLGEVEMEE